MNSITIYCASSPSAPKAYLEAARETGRICAEHSIATVTGAGATGLMSAVVDGTLSAGGHAIGVIPQFMVDRGWLNPRMSEVHITPDMHSRKALMARLSIGTIALPGGIGTFDELLEIITWRQLRIYRHPVVIVNTGHYFDRLLDALRNAADCGLMRHFHDLRLWHVVTTPAEAVETILNRQDADS